MRCRTDGLATTTSVGRPAPDGSAARPLPVVVVGAGPVGQSAALLLARWGVPSVVLDERTHRESVGSKALCQQRDVLDIWDSVGVGRRVADEGVTWTTARTFYREHELFSLTFADSGRSPFPPWVNVSQSRTEALLDERIAAEPLVDVRWSHRVCGLLQDGNGVTLDVDTPDGPRRLRTRYVLACSGLRSDDLRDALGLRLTGRSYDDRFLICDIRAELPGWERERRFFFDPAWNPGRQVLIHPCPDSVYRIDWQVPADYDLAADEASGGLDARIRAIVGDAGYEVVWKSVYRFHSRCVESMRVGRVLLAGDAAHVVAPFGARGLNSGVQDAENATWKLAFVLRGWAPPALLASYDEERLAAARENLDVTSATMRFLVPQDDAERRTRRDVLERAITEPAARSMVDSGRLAEPFWYAASPLTTPSAGRAPAQRPPAGRSPTPGPGVLLPDLAVPAAHGAAGEPVRLRALARSGLLVLLAPGAEAAGVRAALGGGPVPVHVVDLGATPPGGASGGDVAARSAAHTPTPVDAADPVGDVAAALGMAPGEVWLVRPDAHVAAVVSDPAAVQAAVRRCLGYTVSSTSQPQQRPDPAEQERPDALLPARG